MTERDEQRMYAGILLWKQEQPRPPKREPRNYIAGETWEEKYDRLYREIPRKEWFGKRFNRQYIQVRART